MTGWWLHGWDLKRKAPSLHRLLALICIIRFLVCICVGTCTHLCVIFAIHGPIFWTNENMKKDELYCINVDNYVYKVVSYDCAVFELKEILRTMPMGMLSKKMYIVVISAWGKSQ